MLTASGVRLPWSSLPAEVHAHVAGLLGAPVVAATSQPGGFSPGSADRVVAANGERAFVKAVSAAQNPDAPDLHRRKATVTAGLPVGTPAPRLLGTYDDGTWVALVLEDVAGRHPATPWVEEEVQRVLAALDALAAATTPCPVDVRDAREAAGSIFGGWAALAADPWPALDPWAAARLPELAALAADAVAATAGDTLVHLDVRADNLLVRPSGDVLLVDWPHAARGAAWLDAALFLVNPAVFGGHDPEALVPASAVLAAAPPSAVTAVVAGMAGFFLHGGRLPDPPGLPTLRAFQRAQGEAALGWLRVRLG